jgi:hypothetical protein
MADSLLRVWLTQPQNKYVEARLREALARSPHAPSSFVASQVTRAGNHFASALLQIAAAPPQSAAAADAVQNALVSWSAAENTVAVLANQTEQQVDTSERQLVAMQDAPGAVETRVEDATALVRGTQVLGERISMLDNYNRLLQEWFLGMLGIMQDHINTVMLHENIIMTRNAQEVVEAAKRRVAESEARMVQILNFIWEAGRQERQQRIVAELNAGISSSNAQEAARRRQLAEAEAAQLAMENRILGNRLAAAEGQATQVPIDEDLLFPNMNEADLPGPSRPRPTGGLGKPGRYRPTISKKPTVQEMAKFLGQPTPEATPEATPDPEPHSLPPSDPSNWPPLTNAGMDLAGRDLPPRRPGNVPVPPLRPPTPLPATMNTGVPAYIAQMTARARSLMAGKQALALARSNATKWGALIPSNKNYNPLLADTIASDRNAQDAFLLGSGGGTTTRRRRRRTYRKRKVSRRR